MSEDSPVGRAVAAAAEAVVYELRALRLTVVELFGPQTAVAEEGAESQQPLECKHCPHPEGLHREGCCHGSVIVAGDLHDCNCPGFEPRDG